jgi:hypothetical protein
MGSLTRVSRTRHASAKNVQNLELIFREAAQPPAGAVARASVAYHGPPKLIS